MQNIKSLYEQYKAATAAADKADELYGKNPDNRELEENFDRLYTRQWDLFDRLAREISTASGIDYKLTRRIILEKGPQLDCLMGRLEGQ